uniref:Galactosylceramide sulfotransferase n=2 Tax=Cacopsylla melanoneura TaxID=428564 RepID=A0A8D9EGG3_9HEMI
MMRVSSTVTVCSFVFFGIIVFFTVQSLLFRTSCDESEHVIHNGSNCQSRCITKEEKSIPTLPTIARKRESIFFLKAHKCGSSTVQNILLRYGRENNLSFVLPYKQNYIGHPKPFSRGLISEDLRTQDNKYNVFAHHSRYNSDEVKLAMKPDAAFVTILRDPGTLFESLYTFCRFERRYNISFEKFKSAPAQHSHLLHSRHGSRFGRNQMCFDLGLDETLFFQDKYVNELIDDIEKDFDLVMISEYMEVSLVLLADLMGWPLEQVVYLNSNVRQEKNKNKLTEDEMEAMRAINPEDTKLYKHFLEKFKRRVEAYGVDRMKLQVDKLIRLNQDLYQMCVEEENTRGYAYTYSYRVKSGAPVLCYLAAKGELHFTEQLRKEQLYKLRQLRNIERLMSKNRVTMNHVSA